MRILIAEDEKSLNNVITKTLTKNGYSVDSCFDGEEALDYLAGAEYDAVILDIMMPKLDGISVLKKFRASGSSTPVLFLTAKDAVSDRVQGLDAGADDYLVKPFAYEELSARIRSLGRRSGKWEEREILIYGDISYEPLLRELCGPGGCLMLSSREGRLAEVFLREPEAVLRRMVLFSRVWGADAEVEEGNLDTYVHFLRKRFAAVKSRLSLTTIRGVGYRLENPDV